MPSTALRKQLMAKVRRMVVKVGTNVLTDSSGGLDTARITQIARQLAVLHNRGLQVTLVTSGAVGAGMGIAGLTSRPKETPVLQACAAVGQPTLMTLYARALRRYKVHAGQVLVTRTDFEQRIRYVNIRNTIEALRRLGALAIINENDTIAVDELDRFADNDTIAALVANLLRADLTVLLTSVDGLLDATGQRIDLVPRVTTTVAKLAKTTRSPLGSGGMTSKLKSVSMVTESGEAVVIANGRETNVLLRLLDGERIGTFFAPASNRLSTRHRWIRNAARPTGQVVLDAGAAEAVLTQGKSLLARGITQVTGTFARGAIVLISGPGGEAIAHGVSNYNSDELQRIKGLKSSEIAGALGSKPFDEAVHRDNLVLLGGD